MNATWSDLAQLITAVSALLAVVFTLRNGNKIQEVYISLNSRLSQLLKTTAIAAHKEGHQEGVQAERRRVADGDK